MKTWSSLASLTLAAAGLFFVSSAKSNAQIAVQIGAPPVCPYGYYEAPPYTCAPDGYYGPEWFSGGIFIGAGPWFHGPHGFHGYVDHRFDYRHGYHGPYPERGAHPVDQRREFHGRQMHDEHGHEFHPHR